MVDVRSALGYVIEIGTVTACVMFASNFCGLGRTSVGKSAYSVETTLITLLNKERSSRGLRPLQLSAAASSAARAKSQDMVRNNYFGHTSPTLGSPAQLLTRCGVGYRTWAENIGKASDAARIHAMWMASAGHRTNLLNPAFTHVGIGSIASNVTYTATQLFFAQ